MPVLRHNSSPAPLTRSSPEAHRPTMMIDHTSYPYILDLIVAFCEPAALLVFRAASKTWQLRIDRILVRHLRISFTSSSRHEVDVCRVEALRSKPDGPPYRNRLPFGRVWEAAYLLPRGTTPSTLPHVVLDLHIRRCSFRFLFSTVCGHVGLTSVSTIRVYAPGTGISPEGMWGLPRCDVYVAPYDFPDLSFLSPIRPGGRIVLLHPFWLETWSLLRGAGELEVVFVFQPPENHVIFRGEDTTPEETARTKLEVDLSMFFKNLGMALATITDHKKPQITLVNLSPWSHACPDGLQTFARLAFDTNGSGSPTTTSAKMACLRFQTLEEYCSRVGEDQVRLELGPELARPIGL